jgi:RNA polymerase sigma-70 factor (ECF subfamily)
MPLARSKRARAEFEEVALPHLDSLFGAAYRLTRNPRDAEDLVQDAILRAYRFWDSFEKDSNCKAWLFKILTNTFINGYQKKKRSREILNAAVSEQQATDGILIHEQARSQRDPQDILIDQTLSDDVTRALAALPTEFRLTVVLCDVEGFSYREIAEILECPVGTVMSRLYRGRRLLRKSLFDFAVNEGIVKADSALAPPTPELEPTPQPLNSNEDIIDIAQYRERKN